MKLIARTTAAIVGLLLLFAAFQSPVVNSTSGLTPIASGLRATAFMVDTRSFPNSAANPAVLEVSRVLAPVLRAPGSRLSDVRKTLFAAFPGNVKDVEALGYVHMWDPIAKKWVLVCSNEATFDVTRPSGVVRVDARNDNPI